MALPLVPPAKDPATIEPRNTSGYPEPYRSRCLPREKRALGDPLGLTKVGVNLTTLMPGKESSMRHWHTHEDELIYVLEGEVTLVTDDGEQLLTPGTYAGFPAGTQLGHQLVNRSDQPARYLEVSNRHPEDSATYTDPAVDLTYKKVDGKNAFFRRDGSPY
ncbi:MAG TPA: cupin domain-containing protein [Kofleriaceae bacterium]|nr:cupin domain-containing protein [Kofleriaceae bacterium]